MLVFMLPPLFRKQVDRIELSWDYFIIAIGTAVYVAAWNDTIYGAWGTKAYLAMTQQLLEAWSYKLLSGVPIKLSWIMASRPWHPLPPPNFPALHFMVTGVRTSRNGERLAMLKPLSLRDESSQLGFFLHDYTGPKVLIDPNVSYQTFLGFGGAFTESSALVLRNLSAVNQQRVIDAYFSNTTGLGYRLGRVHMNSCDFSVGRWSCAEDPGDVNLTNFTIEHYEEAMIPMMKAAELAAGEPLKLLASPWSPPRWMKDNQRMIAGGRLNFEYADAWALHYVKFAQAFKARGLPLWAFSVQNEPEAFTGWENCLYSAHQEVDFVGKHLGPALEASGLDLKLLVWDHNRDGLLERAQAFYSQPNVSRYVWGTAYHWYGDNRHDVWAPPTGMTLFDNLRAVHEYRPDKHIVMSEACQELGPKLWSYEVGERYGEAILRDLNNWLEAWFDWNLLLNARGGPNHVHNYVSAPVIADLRRDQVILMSAYYYIAHFSRYIRPGAVRISAGSNRDVIEVTAFRNPDGSVVLVMLNRSGLNMHTILLKLLVGTQTRATWAKAPPHSITTLMFPSDAVMAAGGDQAAIHT